MGAGRRRGEAAVKFVGGLISALLSHPEMRHMRRNIRAFARFLLFLAGVIALYTVLFHVIMLRVEGREHSWLTGLYWTLTVMTTLGFGDVTFSTDTGRLFSIVVLVTGVVLLVMVLPFMFIRFFYGPWLEAKVRLRAPRAMPAETRGHVVIARWDSIAAGLVERLRGYGIPYVVIEPDPADAGRMLDDGISVLTGEVDARSTYENARLRTARLLLANAEDTTNTNVTLTAREVSAEVPIVSIVTEQQSIEILQLSGSTDVLPLKKWLGEYLAARTDTGRSEAHVIGRFKGLVIAEFALRATPLAGKEVRDTRLRETTGLNVVGVWERGRLQPAFPRTGLSENSVIVVAGTPGQVDALEGQLQPRPRVAHPVLVLGCGKVGRAAAEALHGRGAPVYAMDRVPARVEPLRGIVDRVFAGDGANRDDLKAAGLDDAATALLTTNDDATNIYLAVYCRRLRPDLRIVSRVNHRRNLESIHRAGADFVLSYDELGVDAVMSIVERQELVVLGEGIDLFTVRLPRSLENRTLAETGIGSRTGLSVVAVQQDGQLTTALSSDMVLAPGTDLIMLGSLSQRRAFASAYDPEGKGGWTS
jgi:Trk K+ transport system NAD-binding subunit